MAVGNIHLYETTRQRAEHLEIAMQNRAVIEQAKGILMAQRRCDAAEAFNILAAASQRANRKLREIAAAIVAGRRGTAAVVRRTRGFRPLRTPAPPLRGTS